MTDEERQRMMEFILAQQAQFWATMQKNEEDRAAWQAKHEAWQAKHGKPTMKSGKSERKSGSTTDHSVPIALNGYLN